MRPVRGMIDRLRLWAKAMRRDVVVLALAARDPRVPLPAKLLALAVVAYALSPIDLIPDFIPVLGALDDLLLVPLGLFLALRLVPPPVLAELRTRATALAEQPKRGAGRAAAAVIVALWVALLGLFVWLALGLAERL